MNGREDTSHRTSGVQETAAPWVAPTTLRARPQADFSVSDAARETMRRFPKILAKLAE